VDDREILETYLNSASKNTLERDIFPHGTKSTKSKFKNKYLYCPYMVFAIIYFIFNRGYLNFILN